MLGPAVGSLLYSAGGFLLPFVVVGSIGLVVATALLILIPNVRSDESMAGGGSTGRTLTFGTLVKVSWWPRMIRFQVLSRVEDE